MPKRWRRWSKRRCGTPMSRSRVSTVSRSRRGPAPSPVSASVLPSCAACASRSQRPLDRRHDAGRDGGTGAWRKPVLRPRVALHDARRDEVYLEIDGARLTVLLFDARRSKLLRDCSKSTRPIALAGTRPARACDALATSFVLVDRPPARCALGRAACADDCRRPTTTPRPLYLRAPDAKLPAARHDRAPLRRATTICRARASCMRRCFAEAWSGARAARTCLQRPERLRFVHRWRIRHGARRRRRSGDPDARGRAGRAPRRASARRWSLQRRVTRMAQRRARDVPGSRGRQ